METGQIKRQAAASLKAALPQGAAITGIFFLCLLILVEIQSLFVLFLPPVWAYLLQAAVALSGSVFLLLPLLFGVQRWSWRRAGGADDSLQTVLYAFSERRLYRRAVGLSARWAVPVFAIALPTALPLAFCLRRPPAGRAGDFVLLAALALFAVGWGVAGWLSLRYFLAPYLLAGDEVLTPKEALRLSFRVMRGRVAGLLCFLVSFAGWFLLCFLVLPLPYVFPLLLLSAAGYARQVVADHNRRVCPSDEKGALL